ncbi:MAG: type II toxin-antitoxin system PemK/MazF family toxin [Planctomycetota bacterium]|nr:type II toxin-antitoxin system PemK/MazF family toxin [Planctomycetota bacterium]
MTPQRGEIYLVRAQWRECVDIRPCVVVDVEPHGAVVLVALISAAIELYVPQQHLLIAADQPDFRATGLRRDSYCSGAEMVRLPIQRLGKRLGRLEGGLAQAFDAWIG